MPRNDDSFAKVAIGRKRRTLNDLRNLEEEEFRGSSYRAGYNPAKDVL